MRGTIALIHHRYVGMLFGLLLPLTPFRGQLSADFFLCGCVQSSFDPFLY